MNDFMQKLKLYKFMSRLDGWQAQMPTQIPVRDWIRRENIEAAPTRLERQNLTENKELAKTSRPTDKVHRHKLIVHRQPFNLQISKGHRNLAKFQEK
ncbi:hypothetical protein M8J76_002676 [Diaphorina citri]|nr:hypothetical protein M8J76_002676 [Diaphorina citri]